jgi:hypothetical protein
MAVYPVAPGAPDLSTGSSSQYIPAIYSALLVKKFYPKCVSAMISNTDYEGDIKSQGDTVYIRTRPTIETFRYKKGMVLPVQNPESPYQTLKIDQGEGFSFAIDKVDEFQSDIKLMNTWAEDATEQMKQVLDRNMLVTLAAAGAVAGGQLATTITGYAAANAGPSIDQYTIAKGAVVAGGTTAKGTAISTGLAASNGAFSCNTSALLVARILKYGRYLNENNAPPAGRFVILPPWAMQALKDISAPFGQAYATGQNMANAISGKVPSIDGFEIIESNNLPTTTESVTDPSAVIFGCKYATTFATQITESRIIDNPFAFGKMMQGLQVYGFNVIKPALLGVDFIKNA